MSNNHYVLSDTKNNSVIDSKLLYISSAKYGGDWHSSPHSHRCTELFYVVGGKGGFQIENDTFQVKPHDLVVINPNVQHTETSLNASPLEYIVLGVEGLELISQGSMDERFFMISLKEHSDAILPCIKIILKEAEGKLPGSDSVCQNLLQALFIMLLRITQVSPEMTVRASRRECATAKWYIDTHYKEKINLDRLAEFCGINKYYLAHSFSDEYGISPIQYLSQRRIDESKYLLSTTDLPLGRISQMLGFSSASYYTQMFQRAVGVTPSAYRAATRLGETSATESVPKSQMPRFPNK